MIWSPPWVSRYRVPWPHPRTPCDISSLDHICPLGRSTVSADSSPQSELLFQPLRAALGYISCTLSPGRQVERLQ